MMRAAKLACMIAGAAAAALAFCMPAGADTNYIRLTPSQTVALYGSSITMRLDNLQDVEFSYAGTSKEYVGSGAYGDKIPILTVMGVSSGNETYYKTILNQAEFVYYHARVRNWQYYAGTRFTATLRPMLAGISGYEGNFLFSYGGYNASPNNTTRQSTLLFNTTQGQKTYSTELGFSYTAVLKTALEPVSAFGTVSDGYTLAATFTAMYDNNAIMFPQQQQFDMDTITVTWASAGGIYDSAITGGYTDLYFAIQCPRIYDYTPPVVTTTTPAATTRRQYTVLPPQSTAPAYTVDLSTLESGVAAIVQQGVQANNTLDWIGNNAYIGVNNLAYIADRLDDIYAAMQQAGQIPVDSSGELMSGVRDGLTSYTTARIPDDATAGLTFWAWLMGKIMEQAWIAGLASLGACLAVTYFILFRGRNS